MLKILIDFPLKWAGMSKRLIRGYKIMFTTKCTLNRLVQKCKAINCACVQCNMD